MSFKLRLTSRRSDLFKDKKVIGVFRESPFAPLLFREDARVLEQTIKCISQSGFETELTTIDRLKNSGSMPFILLNMCEGTDSLVLLEEFEKKGARVINRPEAVRNCYRIRMISMLSEHSLPFAKSAIINLEGKDPEKDLVGEFHPKGPLWLKRGDVHCTQKGDVRLIVNAWELEEGLKDFTQRGISHAILQTHLEGDLVKFYAVKDRSFFKCYVQCNDGKKKPYPQDISRLQKISSRAAEILGLEVYGGDFIVSAQETRLIDINAWPSFAVCFETAASEIANFVVQSINTQVKA